MRSLSSSVKVTINWLGNTVFCKRYLQTPTYIYTQPSKLFTFQKKPRFLWVSFNIFHKGEKNLKITWYRKEKKQDTSQETSRQLFSYSALGFNALTHGFIVRHTVSCGLYYALLFNMLTCKLLLNSAWKRH